MAGFLGIGNYSKPGPGISKDEPQKNDFFFFFELYFSKFWKLCEINILYFICCIPFFIPCFLTLMYQPGNVVLFYLSLAPLIGISVIISGLVYILRNFARQQHVFLWMDFFDTIKKNWKQSLAIGAIDYIVYLIMYTSFNFYNSQIKVNSWYSLPLVLCLLFIVIFTTMQYYLHIMLITFDLSIKKLLKNAFIFSFMGFGHNILIVMFCGLLVLLVYVIPILTILIPFILISTVGFIVVFNAWIIIERYMFADDTTNNELNDGESKKSIFADAEISKNK
jgi:uncharacterized membrane protein YesL